MRKIMLCAIAAFGGCAQADEALDFVRQVMRTEMAYGSQFMDSDQRAANNGKGRWTDERNAHAERIRNISPRFILDNDIDPAKPLNAYLFDDYEILGRSGSLFFIRRILESCRQKKGCVDDTVLALKVAQENGRHVLVPGDRGWAMLPYWWASSVGRFELPESRYCTPGVRAAEDSVRRTVSSFMNMMTATNEKSFTRKERLGFIAPSFFREHRLEPAFLQLNNEEFVRHSIVGVHGPFVDVEIFRGKCGTCGRQFFRLKTVHEDGSVRITPSGTTSLNSQTYINFWWTRSFEQIVSLCPTRE